MKFKNIFEPCYDWLRRAVPVLSPYGQKALKRLLDDDWPDSETLQQNFKELEQAVNALETRPELFTRFAPLLAELRDIDGTMQRLENRQILDETELFEIKTLALNLTAIMQQHQHLGLSFPGVCFADLKAIISILNPETTLTSSFYIYEAYSPELRGIRIDKRRLEERIVSCRDQEERENLRCQRAQLVAAEKQCEAVIRARLCESLNEFLPQLQLSIAAVTALEMLLAKAVLAQRWPSCRPEFGNSISSNLILQDAVNPEVAEVLEAAGKSFCPVSIELQQGTTVLTGANMGGKTVAMQTIAFNTQLARIGFYPFAGKMCLPQLDFIVFVGGDSQNPKAGLSSFGAEVINLSAAAKLIKTRCGLALFDEFARSTNPSEGSRFVQALCEFLQQHQSHALVSTHYDGIKVHNASFYQVIGLKNQQNHDQIEVNPDHLLDRLCRSMDYRLQRVSGTCKVPHDALQVAQMLQIDPDFLAVLKKFYD